MCSTSRTASLAEYTINDTARWRTGGGGAAAPVSAHDAVCKSDGAPCVLQSVPLADVLALQALSDVVCRAQSVTVLQPMVVHSVILGDPSVALSFPFEVSAMDDESKAFGLVRRRCAASAAVCVHSAHECVHGAHT